MTVFIHGYGTNVSSKLQKPLSKHKGLKVAKDLKAFEAFEWSIPATFSDEQTHNPLSYLDLYLKEHRKSKQITTHQSLKKFFDRTNPTTIICHSLGCELLLNYLENYNVPTNVKEVVFLQPNTSALRQITNTQFIAQVESEKISAITYFCPWDITLMIGSIVNCQISAGLFGFWTGPFSNIFLPAISAANPHTACLSEPKLLKYFSKP